MALATAATARTRRRVGSMGIDMLLLESAWVIWVRLRVIWVRAEGKLQLPLGLLSCYTKSMKKTIPVKQKVMGRPRSGITPLMGFRADPVIRASIVKWAEKQPDMPTLSEAIRRLVELGLKAKAK
jgi:hypothetical protein